MQDTITTKTRDFFPVRDFTNHLFTGNNPFENTYEDFEYDAKKVSFSKKNEIDVLEIKDR